MKKLNVNMLKEMEIVWNDVNRDFGFIEMEENKKLNEAQRQQEWDNIVKESLDMKINNEDYKVQAMNVVGGVVVYKA